MKNPRNPYRKTIPWTVTDGEGRLMEVRKLEYIDGKWMIWREGDSFIDTPQRANINSYEDRALRTLGYFDEANRRYLMAPGEITARMAR